MSLRKTGLFPLFLIMILMLVGCTSPTPTTPGDQVGQRFGTLSGTVTDANSGLSLWTGTAEIAGVGKVVIKDGTFQIENVPYGTYTLKTNKTFYQQHTSKISINSNAATVEIQMKPTFSATELDLFARLVHAEAQGESYKGKVAVAATVLNRMLDKDYPNTLSGVVNEVVVVNGKKYYQYEPVLNGAIHKAAGADSIKAVNDALAGWDPSFGATGFFAPSKVGSSSWVRTRPVTTNIGNHRFFK